MIHPAAAAGYREVADRYELGRAGYPHDAVAALFTGTNIGRGTSVVEVGAGTGKFTEALVEAGARVTAVEPVADMRRKLAERLPAVVVVDGTAEQMPLADASADACVAAQAFHWFDGPSAVAEMGRVLRPGGYLGLIWNVTDRSIPWVDDVWSIIDPLEGDAPRYYKGAWREAFEATTVFGPLRESQFRHDVPMTIEGVVDRVLSISFIARLPEDQRETVAHRVRSIARKAGDELAMPYRVDVFTAPRR